MKEITPIKKKKGEKKNENIFQNTYNIFLSRYSKASALSILNLL